MYSRPLQDKEAHEAVYISNINPLSLPLGNGGSKGGWTG